MNNKKASIAILLVLLFSCRSFAGINDSGSRFTFSGYVDAYYAHYSDSAGHGEYQKFPTTSPRSNQIGLNIAQLTAEYNGEKIRGVVALHYGDIPRSTWPGALNFLQEARVGVRLAKILWLDAGLFRSHFGTEGLLPKENITSSIAVNTFYEPYYEAGARLNFIPTDKLTINLYVLNGYNTFEENNNKKSFGLFIAYALGDNGNIGYSNYIGDDTPDAADSISHLRFDNNVFLNYQYQKLQIQVGGDYCVQGNSRIRHPKETGISYGGTASLKYQVTDMVYIYGRGELFHDPEGYLSYIFNNSKGHATGLKIWGATAGLEVKPTHGSYIRLEGRRLMADREQKIFRWDGENKNSRMEISINLGLTIQ